MLALGGTLGGTSDSVMFDGYNDDMYSVAFSVYADTIRYHPSSIGAIPMPRKPAARHAQKTTATKARLELRFDPTLHARLTQLAAALNVSVNQFLEAVTEWAVENAVVGKPSIDDTNRVHAIPEPGYVFFGYPSPADDSPLPGKVHFAIAFHRAWAFHHPSDFDDTKGLLPS